MAFTPERALLNQLWQGGKFSFFHHFFVDRGVWICWNGALI
jgi:hypothetical protein